MLKFPITGMSILLGYAFRLLFVFTFIFLFPFLTAIYLKNFGRIEYDSIGTAKLLENHQAESNAYAFLSCCCWKRTET